MLIHCGVLLQITFFKMQVGRQFLAYPHMIAKNVPKLESKTQINLLF